MRNSVGYIRARVVGTLSLSLLALAAVWWGHTVRDANACGGDPPPPRCGKTLAFTMAVPSVVTNCPDEEVCFDVQTLTYLKLVEVPPGSGICPRPPYRYRIDLTIDCRDGSSHTATASGELSPGYNPGVVSVCLPPLEQQKCVIRGKITVTFADGMVISDTSRQCVCIVDPHPDDADKNPRLELGAAIQGAAIARVHPGDQTSHRFVVKNNDPEQTFRGFLHVESANDSRRPVDESPQGPAPGQGVFAISDPERGDDFPIALLEDLGLDCIILPDDPQNTILPTIDRDIVLAPGEEKEIDVVVRPWGMCADGSCGRLTLELEGVFADGSRGLACAGAIVAADTLARPQYVWADSGAVSRVNAADKLLRFSHNPTPTAPPRTVQTEIVAMNLVSVEPIPWNGETQTVPLGPEHGRFVSQLQGEPVESFNVDSFFDIEYRIDLGESDPPPVPIEMLSMDLIPGAPSGFENTAPLGMGTARLPPSGNFNVDSFFDIVYQVEVDVSVEDRGVWDTEMISMSLTSEGNSILVSARLRAVPPGDGDAAGIIGTVLILGVEVRTDLRGFSRPGTPEPCPPPEFVGLTCRRVGDDIVAAWGLNASHCPCDSIQIRDESGTVIQTLPGDATKAVIPCERLGESGVLCFVCLGPDGERLAEACCDYSCRRDCPPFGGVTCDVQDGVLNVSWPQVPDGCCERYIVSVDGVPFGAFPASTNNISVPCADLPATSGTVCVTCIHPDGTETRACCDYSCEIECPDLAIERCESVDGTVRLAWTPMPQGCCERIEIRADGVVVRTLPGSATTAIIRCDELPEESGTICVVCIAPDGTESRDCCEYSCPPDCPPLEITCVTEGDVVVVSWEPLPDECCEEVRILNEQNEVVATAPNSDGEVRIPCDQLDGLQGTLCAVCVSPGGAVSPRVCCDYSCVPDCPPIGPVTCELVDDVIVASWPALPQGCCEAIRVTIEGTALGITVAPTATEVRIPCDQVPASGTVRVTCIAPDGSTSSATCDYSCDEDCPPLEILRCESVNNGVLIEWRPMPEGCCDEIEIRHESGRVLATLPGTERSIFIPCTDLPSAAGVICVICRSPNGESEACCDYFCEDAGCDEPCVEAGCCEPTGCNGVRVCTVLPPDQFQFDVFINLQSWCGDILMKECQASFSLRGDPNDPDNNPGGENWTIQEKCRALVDAIRSDPRCQALGYRVVDEDCEADPPCFTVIDASCPGAKVVMGTSNDPNIFDQNADGGILPDYESEVIVPLCDPTIDDPTDNPAVVIGFEGVPSGQVIVEEMDFPSIGVLLFPRPVKPGPIKPIRVEVPTFVAGKPVELPNLMEQLAKLLRENGADARGIDDRLVVSNIGSSGKDGVRTPGDGAAAGLPVLLLGGASGFSNDDGVFCGNFGGPRDVLPIPPSGGPQMVRGDCDGDGAGCSGVGDALKLLNWAFLGGPEPPCLAACDMNGESGVEGVTDAVFGLTFCFLGGPAPPAPQPDCGDLTESDLGIGCLDPADLCTP